MNFQIFSRRFDDGFMIVGEAEVPNPNYEGKANPFISISDSGEIMEAGLLPIDARYWADALPVTRPERNFVVRELGGHQIVDILTRIVQKSENRG